MRVRLGFVCLAACLAGPVLGCTWVPLTAAGEQVQLASPKFVEGCEQVGKTRAKTKPTVLGFKRDEATIREELRSLARNDAAVMGGTNVAPLEPVKDGTQLYGIYVCSGGSGGGAE